VRLFHRDRIVSIPREQNGLPVRVPIVADAAIASARIADGKLVPLVIIDTTSRPDLEELIRLHRHFPPGDVKVQWSRLLESPGTVALQLSFIRPLKLFAIIEFNVATQGIVVSQILATQMLYLQAGRDGDRLKYTMDAARMFVEIPDCGFRPYWDKIVKKGISKHMRTKGLNRQQARKAANQIVEEQRRVGQVRMK